MYVRVVGSIQIDVPVNPVCPKEPTGRSSPRLEENGESMSQPKPRIAGRLAGCSGIVILRMASGERTGLPSSRAWANFATSSAVENKPAWPATPPMRRERGS